MHALTVDGWDLRQPDEAAEPMIPDLVLARRLGFERPRDIRKIIQRVIEDGGLDASMFCATVAQNTGRGRPGTEYLLTEEGALVVVMRSRTPSAIQVQRDVVSLYLRVRQHPLLTHPSAINFLARTDLSQALPGHWTVFNELQDIMRRMLQARIPFGPEIVIDNSVGNLWGAKWREEGLEEQFGPRLRGKHYFPKGYPQALSNPQTIWNYPNLALPTYRDWYESVYLEEKFPAYLAKKEKQGMLPSGSVERLLAAG